jgi:hypothetical protein
LASLRENRVLSRGAPPFGDLIQEIERVRGDREWLRDREVQHRGSPKALPEELRPLLDNVSEGGEPVGVLLEALFGEDRPAECLVYWPRILAEAANEADDILGLVLVLKNAQSRAAHTAARKALRRIDFSIFGPPVEEPDA